jgi:hypothetical protein
VAVSGDIDTVVATAQLDVAASELIDGACSTCRGPWSVTAEIAAIVAVSGDIDTVVATAQLDVAASELMCVTCMTDS